MNGRWIKILIIPLIGFSLAACSAIPIRVFTDCSWARKINFEPDTKEWLHGLYFSEGPQKGQPRPLMDTDGREHTAPATLQGDLNKVANEREKHDRFC